MSNMISIQYILDIIKQEVDAKTPQELMVTPTLLDFCCRYGIEKEWR